MRPPLYLFLASLAVPAAAQSVAHVEQVGASNLATLTQSGASTWARIDQVGTGYHVARLDQRHGSHADVVQQGEGHLLAGITMGTPDPDAFALSFDGSQLVVKQVGGYGSRAFVEQRDGASILELFQHGSDNFAVVSQTGGSANQAFIDQAGGAVAYVMQTGSGNLVTINQTPY